MPQAQAMSVTDSPQNACVKEAGAQQAKLPSLSVQTDPACAA